MPEDAKIGQRYLRAVRICCSNVRLCLVNPRAGTIAGHGRQPFASPEPALDPNDIQVGELPPRAEVFTHCYAGTAGNNVHEK